VRTQDGALSTIIPLPATRTLAHTALAALRTFTHTACFMLPRDAAKYQPSDALLRTE